MDVAALEALGNPVVQCPDCEAQFGLGRLKAALDALDAKDVEIERLRGALEDAKETILSNSTQGEDGKLHSEYQCVGRYGYGCRCDVQPTLDRIEQALGGES